VSENRVLRRISGPKRDEVTGEWKMLHSGELHNLYSSPDIIRQIKSRRLMWAGHVARMGEGRNVYRVLVGKPEGKRTLERPGRRWEDGIKMGLREIGWGGVEWIHLAGCRECGDEPWSSDATELVRKVGFMSSARNSFFVYIFTCSLPLFLIVVYLSHYIASNDKVILEYLNGNYGEGSSRGPVGSTIPTFVRRV
jgi:hypothetical protein